MSLVKFLNTSAGVLVAAMLLIAAPPAHALNLEQAKTQGMVCELPTGYLQATGSATAEVRALVENINVKRKAEYERIAKEHNVEPGQVGVLTAKKLEPKCK